MGLKQIKDVDRIVFLKMFVEEVLINFANKYRSKKVVEEEKIKRKILEPIPDELPGFRTSDENVGRKVEGGGILERKPTVHLTKSPNSSLSKIFKRPKSNLNLFGMQKVSKLLKDNAVQMIECPGPGKYLVIKKRNKVNVTKFVMSQDEISKVINSFSEQARIPIVGGVLRAAVGGLMISAVSSQFIGSRFIVNRKTPYSLIASRDFVKV